MAANPTPSSLAAQIANCLPPALGPADIVIINNVEYECRPLRNGYSMRKKDTRPAPYIVTKDSCTCPQYEKRGIVCKHILKCRELMGEP